MSNNVRLIIAIALALGVVLAYGLLSERFNGAKSSSPSAAAAPADGGASAATPVTAASAVPAPATAPPLDRSPAPLPPGAPAPEAAPPPPPDEQLEKLENSAVAMEVSSRRGAIVSWKLKDERFAQDIDGQHVPMDMASVADGVLGVYCYDSADVQHNYADICPDAYTLRREQDAIVLESVPRPGARVQVRQLVKLGAPDNPYVVRRALTLSPAEPGQVVANLVVWVPIAQPAPRGPSSGGFFSPATNQQYGLCRWGGGVSRTTRGGIDARSQYLGKLDWIGVEDTYFIAAFGFEKRDPEHANTKDTCVLDIINAEVHKPLRASLRLAPMTVAGERNFWFVGHIGPKTLDLVRNVPALEGVDDSINYGWFGFIAVPMLRVMQFFHSLVPVWGLAIILLTVMVKLLMLPLTHWSTVSMRRMSALKPLMDEINEKYKDDKQRKNQAVMELYKTHKVNPLGGCFPILVQMPIWIALYRMLGASAELYHVPFLYLPDLTAKDPYFVLPLILGASMFVQQKITPTTVDSTQAKVMQYGMPIMFTVFMLFLPSGLNLYIFVNTVLSIVQQQVTNRLVPMPVLAAAKGAPAAARASNPGGAANGRDEGRSRRKR
ncbi:MAG: YidC/Oxa1 family insertase periplasmic-domain containing protein [Deltaproteobacteria bacterium]|nr:YidC/Oxa1 family insertase periplasmic-domain containing protein [Deltaproteobacteria bacterium]